MPRLLKAIREAFCIGFQPLFTAVVFVAWWFTPGRESAPLELAVALLLLANVAVYWLEHQFPDREDWVTTRADRKIDAFYIAIRVFVLGPVFQVAVLLTLVPVLDRIGRPSVWPSDWPVLARIVVVLVLAELVAFAMHRAMHAFPVLWRFHATHHVQTKLTSARWSSGHPGEFALFQLPIITVVTILNPENVDIAGAIIIGRTTTIIAHSNLPLRSGITGWLLTTPAQHRRHHTREPLNAANFGDVFILFDRLFGSFCKQTTQEVGVGAGRELTLRQQLMLPIQMKLLDGQPEPVPDDESDDEEIIDLRDRVVNDSVVRTSL